MYENNYAVNHSDCPQTKDAFLYHKDECTKKKEQIIFDWFSKNAESSLQARIEYFQITVC